MPTINEAFIQNKIREYMQIQKKVNIVSLRAQFDGFSPDLVETSIQDMIDTNALMTQIDERGNEFLYIGPNF